MSVQLDSKVTCSEITATEYNLMINSSLRSYFIIWRDGSTYYRRNGVTGQVDSNVDPTIVIQDAIDAVATAGGGIIFIRAGTYVLPTTYATGYPYTAALQISGQNYINIIGEGMENTVLRLGNGVGGNIFIVSNSSAYSIQNMTLDGNMANNPDDGIDGSLCGIKGHANTFGILRDLYIEYCQREGLYPTNCSWSHYENIYVRNCGREGIVLDSEDVTTCINLKTNSNGRQGIYAVGGASREVAHVTIIGGNHYGNALGGVWINNAIGYQLIGVKCYRSGDAVNRFDGIVIQDSEAVDIVGCECWENYRSGLLITDSEMVTVEGGSFYNNRYGGVGTDCVGISLTGVCSSVFIEGAKCYNRAGGTQLYGIGSWCTSIDKVIIKNCNVESTSGIRGYVAGMRVEDCIGYKTSGEALSPAFAIDGIALRTVTIPHGLDITPNIEDCQLTAVEDTNVDDWAYDLLKVDNVDGINVIAKINVSTASATGGATAKLGLRVHPKYDF